MRTAVVIAVAVAVLSGPLVAQEKKPVPKDSVRVFVPGCTKGFIFTAGRRTEDEPGSLVVPEGMHLRMNGPKKGMSLPLLKFNGGSVDDYAICRSA